MSAPNETVPGGIYQGANGTWHDAEGNLISDANAKKLVKALIKMQVEAVTAPVAEAEVAAAEPAEEAAPAEPAEETPAP